ncbi:ABC transporter ATP-binding protein [Thermococci archaeon]|nr:MAG: ABC transporter ATP-binding protein [Thermococci archaeon]
MHIELLSLTKYYKTKELGFKKFRALNNISLSVEKGESFGLIGLNGAGKSTLIKLILGVIFPDEGEIKVMGKMPGDIHIKRRISYLPENPVFYESLNGEEILCFIGKLRGLSGKVIKDSVYNILERVDLYEHRKKLLRKYSRGMLQRLGLAQAFIGNPELVILDEPLSGLDPLGRKMARDLIIEANREGSTIFFTSHILEDIEKICTRVGILHKGELLRVAEKEELRRAPLEDIFLETIGEK